MKKYIVAILSLLYTITLFAQDSLEIAQGKRPVRDPWPCSYIMDNQTSETPKTDVTELNISHRFSAIDQGITDIYGFYGSSNIRLNFSYGVTDKFMMGFGTEKEQKNQEFSAKVKVLEQTRNGKIPVSVSLFGDICYSGIKKEFWGENYQFIDRLSFFPQLIVSRKFGKTLSLQATGSYSHINKVPSVRVKTETDTSTIVSYAPAFQNEAWGVSASALWKFTDAIGLMAEYNQGFYLNKLEAHQLRPKPSLAYGLEANTTTHVFQLFVSSNRAITPQYNYLMNQFDMHKKSGIMLGFNIIVKY